jgi:hypothetical protein
MLLENSSKFRKIEIITTEVERGLEQFGIRSIVLELNGVWEGHATFLLFMMGC